MARVRRREGSGDGTGRDEGTRPLSDPQEIAALPRREGKPLDRSDIRALVAEVEGLARDEEDALTTFGWRKAQAAQKLYFGFAERVHGLPSWREFAMTRLKLTRTDSYDLPKLGTWFTEAEFKRLKITRLRRYLVFFDLTGLTTWGALQRRRFPTADGTKIALGSTPPPSFEEIESAIEMLQADVAGNASEVAAAAARAAQLNTAFGVARVEDPTLDGAQVKFRARKGDVAMTTGPLNEAQREGLGRFLLRMAKKKPRA